MTDGRWSMVRRGGWSGVKNPLGQASTLIQQSYRANYRILLKFEVDYPPRRTLDPRPSTIGHRSTNNDQRLMDFPLLLHLNFIREEKQKINNLPVPKTIDMIEEYEKKRKKQVSSMRSLLDYGIGTMIAILGLFLFFRNYFDTSFNERFPPDIWDKVFGGICVVYGGWRIYRGYKKNYFK